MPEVSSALCKARNEPSRDYERMGFIREESSGSGNA
jgi:hypothetical protein